MAVMVTAFGMMIGMFSPLSAQVQSRLSFRRYTTQDGLPQMQAERVWQDSRGYIYIGTLSGLVRFDGHTFTPFLKGKRYNIVSFAEVRGRVWALDFRHRWLVGQDDVEMRKLDPKNRWLLNNFNSGDLPNGMLLMEDEQEEHRWVGSMALGREADEVSIYSVVKHPLLDSMTPDRRLYMGASSHRRSMKTTGRSSSLYIPTEQGLYRVNRNGKGAPRCLSEKSDFYALCRWGRVLYAFAEDGIYTVEDDSVRLHTPFDEWQTGYGLIVRKAGKELLIADEHSLYAFDGQRISKLHGGMNLIKDLLIDRWGRLWMATYEGVYCFFGRHFTNHRLTDENDIARAVAADGDGQMVMGTLNGKIIVDGEVLMDDPENFFIPSTVRMDSCIYLAGRNDVARLSGKTLEWLGLPYERYQYITEADGKLVLVTRQLIAAYDPLTGVVDTLSTEVPHPWCAAADGEGRLWVGSTFGLYCIEGTNVAATAPSPKPVTSQKGFRQQKLIITTMEADTHGAVFFASGDSLFLIRHGEVTELNSQMPGLEGHEVRSLYVSPRGFLVVAAIDGLFVCRVGEDYHLSDLCFFDHTNGFTMIEPLKARMTEASDGTVWLCGVEEMTSFLPEALIADSQADTFIRPPLRWWQHWWVWLTVVLLLIGAVWALTRWYEKRRSHRKMMRLQREKHEKEQLIRAIREEAIKAERTELAQDIVKMTEKDTSQQLTLRTANETLIIDIADIVYLKASGNYTELATFDGSDLIMMGLGSMVKMLEGWHNFVRADRSTVVNVNYICRLNASLRTCTFQSPDGGVLEVSLLTPAFRRLKSEIEQMSPKTI